MTMTSRARSLGLLIIAQLGLFALCGAAQPPESVKYLQLWNKLGSDCEVAHSKVGVPGVKIGDLYYLPGHDGNGFRSVARTGNRDIPINYIVFRDLQLTPKGEIEFWYTPSWNDWSVGHVVDLLYYTPRATNGLNTCMVVAFNDWQNRGAFWAADSRQVDGSSNFFYPSIEPQWTLNQPIKFTLKWDAGLPDGTNKLQLLFNDQRHLGLNPSEDGLSGSGGDFRWDEPMDLALGSRPYFQVDWDRHHWEPNVDGVIDELKVWGYTTRPVADAGPDLSVVSGNLVHLDGSDSFDYDGDPITYCWELIGKPPCSEAKLSNQTAMCPTFVADQIGLYTIKLIVNDGHVTSTADLVQVCAKPLAEAFRELKQTIHTLVRTGVLTRSQGKVLTLKLEQALAKLPKNTKAATHLTQAFINQMEDLIADGIIPIGAGAPLLDLASGIIASIKH